MSGRRFGRETVLTALYQLDVGGMEKDEVLELSWVEQELTEDLKEFIKDLINGSIEHQDEIDKLTINLHGHRSNNYD